MQFWVTEKAYSNSQNVKKYLVPLIYVNVYLCFFNFRTAPIIHATIKQGLHWQLTNTTVEKNGAINSHDTAMQCNATIVKGWVQQEK